MILIHDHFPADRRLVRIVSFWYISLKQVIHLKNSSLVVHFVRVCPAIRVTLILIFDLIDRTTGIWSLEKIIKKLEKCLKLKQIVKSK